MSRTIEAIYENGILKPTKALKLKEHQLVKITISPADISETNVTESTVLETSSMIKIDPHLIPEIAENDEILFENEE